jgi:hypothetical protein
MRGFWCPRCRKIGKSKGSRPPTIAPARI